jgi:hypothetical protein
LGGCPPGAAEQQRGGSAGEQGTTGQDGAGDW